MQLVQGPLIGENYDELGGRFVDMADAFDRDMQNTVLSIGEENGITVHSGVYLQVTGPQFETPAEIEMYRALGADTVGMSVAVEVIAARHMSMRVCVINRVSNMATGMRAINISHESVKDVMMKSSPDLQTLINGLLDSLCEQKQPRRLRAVRRYRELKPRDLRHSG